jgi:clusterin-associated protein 1
LCRPAFLEEFERLEVELQQLYQDYLVRFRCLAYLEQQQDEAEQIEQERMHARQVMSASSDELEIISLQ